MNICVCQARHYEADFNFYGKMIQAHSYCSMVEYYLILLLCSYVCIVLLYACCTLSENDEIKLINHYRIATQKI